jgi:hypothetical protein
LIHLVFAADEEDGGSDPQVPDPKQPDFLSAQQVHEDKRRGEHASRTHPLLSASHTPVTGY